MADELIHVLVDPIYPPKRGRGFEEERVFELIYAEGHISNIAYLNKGESAFINQRRPFVNNESKIENVE